MPEGKVLTPELVVSANPHVRHPDTIPVIMYDVLIALIPAMIAAVFIFGVRSISLIAVCTVSAVGAEAAVQRYRGIPYRIGDGSAAVTGVLLALCCPVTLPFWAAALGSAFAIVVAKEAFGGLGNNPFNPAHIGRAFLLASWPVAMTTWAAIGKIATPVVAQAQSLNLWWNPVWNPDVVNQRLAEAGLDGITTATPLAILKGHLAAGQSGAAITYARETLADAFFGNVGGCIGETSALAILIGGLYLLWRGHIGLRIPLSMLAAVFGLTALITGSVSIALFNLFAGGLMIGAFFMATDMVTSPVTKVGRLVFGVGCGCLIVVIRQFGAYPEGVCYSILIMNAATPIIDYYLRPKVFGAVKVYA